jgi:uncharacterized membrane protein
MDKLELSEKAVKVIGDSAERFIGYLYSGILILILLTIEDRQFVESFVKATGGILTAIICMSAGIGVYAIYFRLIGELFLFPLHYIMHTILDVVTGRWGEKRTCSLGVLHLYGVNFLSLRGSYEFIKRAFLNKEEGADIGVAHGELHVLYITSLILFMTYWILEYFSKQPSSLYLFISLVVYVAALIGDIRQHKSETFILKANKSKVVELLKRAGYIK